MDGVNSEIVRVTAASSGFMTIASPGLVHTHAGSTLVQVTAGASAPRSPWLNGG
jgi:hypothetical protein